MAKQLEQALTYTSAIYIWFGGVQKLALQSLPFTCRCGDSYFPDKDEDGNVFEQPMMKLEDCFKHIRRVHKERIKKQNG